VSLAAVLGVVGIGWVVVQVFPALSLWQASLIALVVTASLLLIVYRLFNLSPFPYSLYDWVEEEEEEVVQPSRRRKKRQ
jgi:hypothetical protein